MKSVLGDGKLARAVKCIDAAINNLGALLLQKQEYAEARRYLEQAWRLRFSLPDNGRRTQLLLQEIARKQSDWQRYRVEAATDLLAAGGAFSLDVADKK